MNAFFQQGIRWNRRRAAVVLLVLGAVLVPAAWSLRDIHLQNDITSWLPANDPQAKTLAWYLKYFPHEDRVLVSWEGSSLTDPRVTRFARRLNGIVDERGVRRGGLKQIRAVLTPQELIASMRVDPDEATRRLEGVLIGRHGGRPVGLLVTLSRVGQSHKTATLQAIRRVAEEVGIEPNTLHLGGQIVAAEALNQGVLKAAWNRDAPLYQLPQRSVLLLTGLVGVVLVLVMLRHVWLAIQVLLIALYATAITVSLVPITGGSMNMVLIVMPPLLLVLTISGAIHVANYWKHAAGRDRKTAVNRAVRMAMQPCALASITTAIGLLSLRTSSLTPVRDFGFYSAIGCLIGLAAVLIGFPALLQLWPPKLARESTADAAKWQNAGRWLSRHRLAVILTTFTLGAVGNFGLRWFHTETKNIRNFPNNSQIVRDYQYLERNLAGVVPVEMIVRFNRNAQTTNSGSDFLERIEVIRELEEKLRQHADISGTLSLADFLPASQGLPPDASAMTRLMYHKRVHEIEREMKGGGNSAAHVFLAVAKTDTDLATAGDHRLNQAGDELWRISARVAILSDLDYGDLTRDLHRMSGQVLEQHLGTSHVVTGMVPLFLETQRAVLESLIRSFVLAFAVIAVVMMVVLRHPVAGLLAMLPNLLPITIVFGVISWCGLAVNIGTMITASVALGIAVDGTLHLITWFRAGVVEGLPRHEAVAQALGHCGPAMWQTSLAVAGGLLMLYPADLLLISRFGWLMAALIGAALLADIVFLPALLAGPLGYLIQRTVASLDPLATPHESACPQPTKERRADRSTAIHHKCDLTSDVHSS